MSYTKTRVLFLATLALLVAGIAAAQDAELVYVDYPEVEIRRPGGATILGDFGDQLSSGDSVITTRYGRAELELADGGTVRVNSDTVYSIQSTTVRGERQTVMNVALGSVRFKFNTIAGRREPVVGAPTAVAGVRGTEFVAHVASDGSTVFVVDEGIVDVSAEGESVRLVEGQGVEVTPGEKPGEPFDALSRAFDYEAYNQEKIDELLNSPERATIGHARRLSEFADQIDIIQPLYVESQAALDAANEKVRTLEGDAQVEFFENELVPLRARTADLFDNMRFYALSGLSLRRHVLGRMYLLLSLEYANDTGDPVYQGFLDAYGEALSIYESRIVPMLDPTDL